MHLGAAITRRMLGTFYNGLGVTQDRVRGSMRLSLAASQVLKTQPPFAISLLA
jgi:hypothetical protein